MGDTRGMRALVAMVLMLSTGFVVLASGPTAVAIGGLPNECVQTQHGETVRFYSDVPLADIDVRVRLGYRELMGELHLVNGSEFRSGQRWLLADQFNRFGSSVNGVTFDNQAPDGYDNPPSGSEIRVRPRQALPDFWGSGDYTFSVQEGFSSPLRDITVTVAWVDCDEDLDGVGDKTRDNCVGLSNRDQRDLDADGKGDPCDPDDDNDGAADVGDNCPTTANPDQTDWDGDRVGNACDTTPGIAPPPPSTTTPVPPGTGTVPPPPGCTAGCAYASTIGLRHQKARHRLTGKVESVALGCRSGVEVTIWRKKLGDDRKLVVATTRPTGTFRTKAPRRAGRYYATVGSPAQPLCGNATSRVVRLRKR